MFYSQKPHETPSKQSFLQPHLDYFAASLWLSCRVTLTILHLKTNRMTLRCVADSIQKRIFCTGKHAFRAFAVVQESISRHVRWQKFITIVLWFFWRQQGSAGCNWRGILVLWRFLGRQQRQRWQLEPTSRSDTTTVTTPAPSDLRCCNSSCCCLCCCQKVLFMARLNRRLHFLQQSLLIFFD